MQSFLTHHGYYALVLFALIEAMCIPIPSEITFGFAGVLAAAGHLSLAVVIVLGTAAEVVGSLVSYTVGRAGGRPLVDRLGRFVLLTSSDLDRADRWFAGRGIPAVILGRAMPVLRAFVSLVAGIGEMPPLRFLVASVIGTLAYVSALSSIGYGVGSAWHRVAHDFSIAGYVLVGLVVVVVAAFIAHRLSVLRRERELLASSDASRSE